MTDRTAGATGLVRALNALGAWRSLMVIVAVVLSACWLLLAVHFGVMPARVGLKNRLGGVAAGDFVFFYAAGALAAEGRADEVYDSSAMTAAATSRIGGGVPELVWPYPPTLSLPLTVPGLLPAGMALGLWVAILIAALSGAGRLTLGSWRLAPIVFLFPGSAFVLFTGQLTAVLVVLLATFVVHSRRWPFVAGVSLGLLAWKPHFVVVPLIAAFRDRHYRIVGLAVATIFVLTLASAAAFGLDAWTGFLQGGIRHAGLIDVEAPMFRFVSGFGAARTAGVPGAGALAFHVLTAAAGCAVGLWLWREATRESVRALGLTGAMLQLTPYALDYDMAFLLLPWALMIGEAREEPRAASTLLWPWLGLTIVVPASYLISIYTNVASASLMLLVVLIAVQRQPRLHHRMPRGDE